MPAGRIAFVTGLHRSGTSPLYRMLSKHPEISGFSNTGVEEDEGQHLQRVVRPAKAFGGPGKFAFDARSYLDETSDLASAQSAQAILADWQPLWDQTKQVWLEKSPPTLVRTRFFKALFPEALFVVLVRHPLVVAKATQKWAKSTLTELVLHWCVAHERFLLDAPFLDSQLLVLRYEGLVSDPAPWQRRVQRFLQVDATFDLPPLNDENARYSFGSEMMATLPMDVLADRFAGLFTWFGYQLNDPEAPPGVNQRFPGS